MYDTMSPDYGYETEEERRKRLEQEALGIEPTPVKQTITTDPRTGQSTMKIEGSVEDLSAQNPLTPTIVGPVNPDVTAELKNNQVAAYDNSAYNRMLQVESGNRDYDAQGRPIVSPKGALYAGQVMPATARDPGFGVTPARNASPEEFDRVGREYYDAMLRKYNGNEQLAQAAYNAGPGRVDRAIQLSQQRGGNPLQYLPGETQRYVQQVGGGQQAALPRQQVQAQPAQPVSPSSLYNLQQPVNQAENMPGIGLTAQPTSTAGLEQQQRGTFGTSIPHVEEYLANKGNLGGLLQLSENQSNPEWIRNKARQDVGFELNAERQKQEAQQKLATMSPMDLERALRERTTGGSWLKAIAFGLLGMNSSAEAEQAKLGIGKETSVLGSDGTPYLIKVSSNGTPIDGYNAKTGEKLNANDLVRVAAGATSAKNATTHTGKMQDVTTGEVYYERTTPQGIELIDTQGKRYAGPTNNLRPFGIGSDIQTQTQLAAAKKGVELMYDPAIAAATKGASYLAEFNVKNGTNFAIAGRDPLGMPLLVDQKTGQIVQRPQQQAPAVQPGQVQQAPTVQAVPGAVPSVAPVSTRGMTPAQIEQQNRLAEEQAKANISVGTKQATSNIEVGQKRSESFNKILDEEIRPQAQAGDVVVNTRKQQFEIFRRPGVDANKIFGLYNAANEHPGDQKLTIIRDLFGGIFKPEAEVSQRLALLNLTPQEKSALMEYNISNQRINAATLKQMAGPGSVSDAEQRANKESNVDPTKIPALGAYNAMSQSQFSGDLARYKGDWATTQPAKNALELDKAWRKEEQAKIKLYTDIAKQRAEFISNNGASTQAVQEGYRRFPIPEYDPDSGTWKKTKPLAQIFGK